MLTQFLCPGCHTLVIMPMQEVFMKGKTCTNCNTEFSPHAMNWTAQETEEKLYAFIGEAVIAMARINKRLGTAYQQGQITAREYMENQELDNAKREIAMRLDQVLGAEEEEVQDESKDECLQDAKSVRVCGDCSENNFGCP